MLAIHDALSSPTGDPLTIAGFLATLAIILLHHTSESAPVPGIVNTALWIKTTNDAIEQAVIKEDDLVCTIEGIETILLFVRLWV
jgi:hypothetical protein